MAASSDTTTKTSENTVEDKLKDLNLSHDELQRFTNAFKNPEFRQLFVDYAQELSDPKNRELYESEIRAVEEERGSNVTFVHPNPGHVLKTAIHGKNKCFINIATNENVDKPTFTKTSTGKRGAHWSLPHCLAGPRDDIDHESKPCTVYDVVFSPDTYRMAQTNKQFMIMLEDSALDSIESNFHCQLDRNNVKRPKMKFKGIPTATIIRKKREQESEQTNGDANESKHQDSDPLIERMMMPPTQNHKVILSNHNRAENSSVTDNCSSIISSKTDENGFTIPTYRIVHRGEFDMQDCTINLVSQVRSMRPKELLIEIDLPLCSSSNNVDLDASENSLKLHCNSPKYALDLALPYPVRESDSHARFDKKQRKLLVTLAVIREKPIVIDLSTEVDARESNQPSIETCPEPIDETVTLPEMTASPSIVTYSPIPFEFKQGSAHLALVLNVKNVDKSSITIENDGQHITICLSSFGSGFYPLSQKLSLDFEEPSVFHTGENSITTTCNEDNVVIVLKKAINNKQLTQFYSGINRDEMKINYFTDQQPVATSSSTLTKENFLLTRPDSSSSQSTDDQQKQLSRKQARKMTRQKRKTQETNLTNTTTTTTDNGDHHHHHHHFHLLDKLRNIKLHTSSNHEPQQQQQEPNKDSGRLIAEEKDDKLTEMPQLTSKGTTIHPSTYRRHMSESNVDFEPTSSGEFKLKGILKNSMKNRSLSESHTDPFNGDNEINVDFQRNDLIFEACGTNDDMTSSNENNSIITSPESAGSSLGTTPNLFPQLVKHVTFNNQVAKKTFKPGGPVSGMRKVSQAQQRKMKKRRRQDSLTSQSSDHDETSPPIAGSKSNVVDDEKKSSEEDEMEEKIKDENGNGSGDYKNPVQFEDIISWQAAGGESNGDSKTTTTNGSKSAVRFTNSFIFELDN